MSLDAIKLSDDALEFNDAPAQVWMRVRDAEKLIYSRNPKRHDFGALIASLARYGYQETAKYDATLRAIKAGNGRIEALAKMERDGKYALPRGLAKHRESGEWCLPILMGTDAPSETEALAYLVDANNITMLGGDLGMHEMARMWDQDIYAGILADLQELDSAPVSMGSDDISALLAGMETQSVGEAESADVDDLVDRAEELNKKWKVETGDLWELGEHRIVCGDCINNVALVMGGGKANMVFTDPPFGNNRGYGRSKLGVRFVDGDKDTKLLFKLPEIIKSVFVGSFCVVWVQWYTYTELLTAFGEWKIDTVLIWDKKAPGLSGRGGYGEQYEMACVFVSGKPKREFFRGNVFTDARHVEGNGRNPHPTMKSVHVCIDILKDLSHHGDVVFDPFIGSGTTLIACEQLKRRCRGIEINPAYVAVALERWYNLTKIEPQRIS